MAAWAEISIHTLRMEGDYQIIYIDYIQLLFQSTPSAWRVTGSGGAVLCGEPDFNPHPPHGG